MEGITLYIIPLFSIILFLDRLFYFRIKTTKLISAVSLSAIIVGCSVNPATGNRQLNFVSESQEIEMGKEADKNIVASMGLYPDQGLQNYVQTLGKKLAVKSERPNLPWTFRVIDDPIVNAFAVPGGFIYVTRGILSHFTNEAELIGVLGHEIGHVTAQHSVNQMSQQQLTQLGVGVAMILKPELQQYSQLAGLGLNLLFLKFSRDDERQADELGVRYMSKANENPAELMNVMQMLERTSQQANAGKMPQWLSTHPDPENRIELIKEEIDKLNHSGNWASVNREGYLNRLNGMIYGANPREGFFEGNTFYQPDMKFKYEFPQGWNVINQKQAVFGVSKNEDAVLQITLSNQSSPQNAAQNFVNQEGIQSSGFQNLNIHGLQAVAANFAAETQQQGNIRGRAVYIAYGGNVFELVGYTGDGSWNNYDNVFTNSINSFSPLNDPNKLNVKPKEIKIISLDRAMTLQEFNKRYPSTIDIEDLGIINQAQANTRFEAGTKLKQVVGGR